MQSADRVFDAENPIAQRSSGTAVQLDRRVLSAYAAPVHGGGLNSEEEVYALDGDWIAAIRYIANEIQTAGDDTSLVVYVSISSEESSRLTRRTRRELKEALDGLCYRAKRTYVYVWGNATHDYNLLRDHCLVDVERQGSLTLRGFLHQPPGLPSAIVVAQTAELIRVAYTPLMGQHAFPSPVSAAFSPPQNELAVASLLCRALAAVAEVPVPKEAMSTRTPDNPLAVGSLRISEKRRVPSKKKASKDVRDTAQVPHLGWMAGAKVALAKRER